MDENERMIAGHGAGAASVGISKLGSWKLGVASGTGELGAGEGGAMELTTFPLSSAARYALYPD